MRIKVLGMALIALAMAGSGLAQATPVTAAAGVFSPVRNVGNGKCLQPEGGSSGEARIVQVTCNGGVAQGWLFQLFSGSSTDYRLINQLSGLCIYMNGPVSTGSPLIQAGCTQVSNERWKPSAAPPNVVTIMSKAGHRDTGLCVDVPGGEATEGLGMRIWTCNGTLAQRWVIGF